MASHEFLVSPKVLSEEEIRDGIRYKTLSMSWYVGEKDYFQFRTKNDSLYFEIVFAEELPECFEEIDATLFLQNGEIHRKRQQKFAYTYQCSPAEGVQINHPTKDYVIEDIVQADNDSYLVYDTRREFKDAHPMTLSREELINIISKNRIIFYTGAGISAAAGIPTMAELCKSLHFEDKSQMIVSLKKAVHHPEELAAVIRSFHDTCFFKMPTRAHYSLKELAFLKNTQIVTENLDYLHEYTGILPYRIQSDHLRSTVNSTSLKDIDYILCIGLSCDDRGFLELYKQHHPEGKIISLDLKQPSYLGDDDYFLQGDLQEIIPQIAERLFTASQF